MSQLTKRPIQVYLEIRQEEALRSLAARENTTLSELIRRGIDLVLSRIPPDKDPAYSFIGLGDSELTDLAQKFDQYLVEELSKESNR
jgi:cell division protein ZapA (FtsZ GTPase activity inhibitor)